MSVLDPHILDTILERIIEAKQDLTKSEEKQQEIISEHDNLRDLVYESWDMSGFTKGDNKTYPYVLKNSEQVLGYLDKLNRGIGFIHELVIKYRYPHIQPKSTPVPSIQQDTGQGNVVVHAGQPSVQVQREDMTRVKSFFTGFWENRLENKRFKHLEKLAELDVKRPLDITTEKIERDPIEGAVELMAALNATKKYYTNCLLVWDKHTNQYFAKQVQENFRARLTRLLGVIESYVYAATDLTIEKIRHTLNEQTHYYTRILEAQAGTPVTIQEIHRPVSEDGFGSKAFEPLISTRTEDEVEEGRIRILEESEYQEETDEIIEEVIEI